MKKIITLLLLVIILLPWPSYAQENTNTSTETNNTQKDEYYLAKVINIITVNKENDPLSPSDQYYQTVEIEFMNGPLKKETLILPFYSSAATGDLVLKKNDLVYVQKNYNANGANFNILDRYRLDKIIKILVIFILVLLIISGWVGIRSLIGLFFSIILIIYFMIPSILAGNNPLLISTITATAIALVSLYVAHGFKLRTSVALAATIITLLIATGLATIAVYQAKLFGLGSEEAFYLQFNLPTQVSLRGLLLGAIIIGILGVLDDITTAQAAVVEELKKANKEFGFKELYKRAQSVGHEHIASLINTLALAYVGASLPLLLLFSQYKQPLSVIINSENIAEEIIRTIVGSTALILAVPITSLLAAWIYSKKELKT